MQELVDRIGRFLGRAPAAPPDERTFATVAFTDIVGSTEKVVELGDTRWHETLVAHEVASREEVARHFGRFIQTTGDGMLATFDGPTRALRCAVAIRERVRALGIEIRVGLHAGPVIVREDGEILASRSIVDLVTDDAIVFADRGLHELKGIPAPQRLYSTSFRSAV